MFIKSLLTKGIVGGLAGLVLCTQPAAAHSAASLPAEIANPALEPMQREVRYADLDLSTAKGQARLEVRLRSAANAVCGSNYGFNPLSEAMEARRCYRSALDGAHRQEAGIGAIKMVRR
jgi:UrcA family protein